MIKARSVLVLLVCAVAACQKQDSAPSQDTVPGGVGGANKGQPDSPTPQVSIISPEEGAVIAGQRLLVRIETKDYEFAYDKATRPGTMTVLPDRYAGLAQEPNSGHVHVYLASYPQGGRPELARFFMVQKFFMPNAAEFALDSVPAGRYRLIVELVAHDHSPRIKRHPTDWPPLDVTTLTMK